MNYVDVFDQLRNIAIVARKCPTPVLQTAYVTAVRDWCTQTQWLLTTVPGSTTANQSLYSLGSDPLLEIIAIKAMSVTFTPQPGGTPQTLPVGVGDSESWNPIIQPGLPRQYAYVPEAQFALFPTPNAVFDLTISVVVSPVDNVRQIPEQLLRKYSSVFEAGALAQLLDIPGEPWTDQRKAAAHAAVFRSGISNGKADAQRNYNTGSQRVRPRPFLI